MSETSENNKWSPEYRTYFDELSKGIADQCRQHNDEALKWHNINLVMITAFALISTVLVLNGPFQSTFTNIMPWVVTLAGASNAGLLYMYGKLDPMAKEAAHTKAISAKSAITDRILQELLQDPGDRENPDEFLTWIHKDLGIVGDASPYLWMSKPLLPKNEKQKVK